MNAITQNVTGYVTGGCYDKSVKRKLDKGKPLERVGRKAMGSKTARS